MSSSATWHDYARLLPGRRPAVRAALAEYVRRVATEYADEVVSITLYGSQARGDADDESDIDLFVVVRRKTPALEEALFDLGWEVEFEHNVVISDLICGLDELHAMQAKRFPFYQNVEQEGIGGVDERIRAYARLRLDRAREDLETARENIASDRFRAAINRSYYAMFHIASAALLTQAVKRSKHSGVQAAFAEFLVKPGRIEPEFSRLYRRSRSQREAADYQDEFVADEATARQALADAERFVERVERFLREVGAL